MQQRPQIIFHINLADPSAWRTRRRLSFFTRLAEICERLGIPFKVCPRDAALTRPQDITPDGCLHIVEDGGVSGEGWLNAALGYLLGFWHLDPNGVLADSAARTAIYAPRSIDLDAAQDYFKSMRRRFVNTRLTRYNPTREADVTLPQGSIAVFLQGNTPYLAGQCAVPMCEIIAAACRVAQDRPVVVKPHPLSVKECALAIAKAADMGAAFRVFDGNIHDLLHSCAVTVSVNSAAAMEGFLHRKPAILFGRSDFEGLVSRAHTPDDFPHALELALTKDWRFAKMVYWYFTKHTIEVDAPDFEDKVFERFAQVGYPRARLGV